MFIVVAAALLGSAPPAPVDPDVRCIVDRIPASARAALNAEAESGVAGPVRQAFQDAGTACARERSWTPAVAENAALRAAGLFLREGAAASLASASIPVELIDRWIDALPAESRNPEALTEAGMEQLVLGIVEAGVPVERTHAQAGNIGKYVVGRMMAEMPPPAAQPPR